MQPQSLQPGATATLLGAPRFRHPGRCYSSTVRILEIRKNTARIEARRRDGTTKRRFVKLARLCVGVRWNEWY
jgi:hypothetical protein